MARIATGAISFGGDENAMRILRMETETENIRISTRDNRGGACIKNPIIPNTLEMIPSHLGICDVADVILFSKQLGC